MAAPTFVQNSGLGVQTGGNINQAMSGVTVGNMILVVGLPDGTTPTSFTASTITNIANLAGTPASLTQIGSGFSIGNPVAARLFLYLGRATDTTVGAILTPNSGTDDCYSTLYEFSGVHTGSTLSDVIENGSAGATVSDAQTSTTVSDAGVTTLGADRLAVNVIGVGDDNNLELTAMTGETGGDWTYPTAALGSATGTDAAIAIVTATIASAGTINGGSDAITSDPWGVVGFALIPPSAAAPASLIYQPGRELAIPQSLYRR